MIEGILSKDVDVWWPYVKEYLSSALEQSLGEYSLEDIRNACKEADMQLWIKTDKDVLGACVTKINTYPQKKILVLLLLGGKGFIEWTDEGNVLMSSFAKENNCDYLQVFGRKEWTRRLKELKYKNNNVILTKEIY